MDRASLLKDLKRASQTAQNAERTVSARRRLNEDELKTAVFQLCLSNLAVIQILEALLRE